MGSFHKRYGFFTVQTISLPKAYPRKLFAFLRFQNTSFCMIYMLFWILDITILVGTFCPHTQ